MSFHVFLLVLLSVSMHAAWNFLSKKTMPSASFFCISSFAAAICWAWAIPVAGVPETALSTPAIKLWILSFCCETLYFIGLFKAYAATDISLAYPVVRALPVLMVAALTAIIYPGHYPSNWGITGLLTVCCGCLLMPLKKFSDFSLCLMILDRFFTEYSCFNILTTMVIITALFYLVESYPCFHKNLYLL